MLHEFPFAVGDRVVAIGDVDGIPMRNMTGTVVHLRPGRLCIGVQFDNEVPGADGHTCEGHSEAGYGRYGTPEDFDFFDNDFSEEPSKELTSFIMSFDRGVKK